MFVVNQNLYQSLNNLTGSIGTLQWNGKWHMFLEGIFQQYLLQAGERKQDIQVPRTIQKISLSQNDLPEDKCGMYFIS